MSVLKQLASYGGYVVSRMDNGLVVMTHDGKVYEGDSAYEIIRGVKDIEARAELLKQWGVTK